MNILADIFRTGGHFFKKGMNCISVIVLIVETLCKKLSPLLHGDWKKIEKISKNVRFLMSCRFNLKNAQKTYTSRSLADLIEVKKI